MAYLFSVNKKGTILFCKDAMNLCPEFQFLTEKDKLCLVLIVDYQSPFNQLPEIDRRHKARLQVYGDNDISSFDKKVFKNAIELYKSLQHNSKREMMNVYRDKIDSLSADLVSASVPSAIKNILESQRIMRIASEELAKDSDAEEERKLELRGKGTLSLLEEIMSNKEEYERVKAKR